MYLRLFMVSNDMRHFTKGLASAFCPDSFPFNLVSSRLCTFRYSPNGNKRHRHPKFGHDVDAVGKPIHAYRSNGCEPRRNLNHPARRRSEPWRLLHPSQRHPVCSRHFRKQNPVFRRHPAIHARWQRLERQRRFRLRIPYADLSGTTISASVARS